MRSHKRRANAAALGAIVVTVSDNAHSDIFFSFQTSTYGSMRSRIEGGKAAEHRGVGYDVISQAV